MLFLKTPCFNDQPILTCNFRKHIFTLDFILLYFYCISWQIIEAQMSKPEFSGILSRVWAKMDWFIITLNISETTSTSGSRSTTKGAHSKLYTCPCRLCLLEGGWWEDPWLGLVFPEGVQCSVFLFFSFFKADFRMCLSSTPSS